MTTTTIDPLEAVKQRQQATWASGDYSAVAALIVPVAERLVDLADLRAGSRVLDVATGSANAAIAAARLQTDVVGIDYVEALLDRGRERAAAEGLEIDLRVGDAEELPFPDSSFDAVLSVFGSMFAPNQEQTAGEIVRVTRPGGTIALASWTPDGFLGALFRTVAQFVPPPAGVKSPMLWGTRRPPRLALRPARPLEAHDRDLHLPLPDRRSVRRLLRRALRPDVEGHRSCRRPRRGAQIRPHRAGPDLEPTRPARPRRDPGDVSGLRRRPNAKPDRDDRQRRVMHLFRETMRAATSTAPPPSDTAKEESCSTQSVFQISCDATDRCLRKRSDGPVLAHSAAATRGHSPVDRATVGPRRPTEPRPRGDCNRWLLSTTR